MGCQRTTLPIYPSMVVHTCCQIWAERSREVNPLWLPAGPPKLDSEVDVSAVQLVGYQMSSKEIRDRYCQVHALKRLPGPPPCGPERAQEITKGYCVFLKRLPRAEEGGTARRRWRTGVCQHSSTLPLQLSFTERKAGHFRGARTC